MKQTIKISFTGDAQCEHTQIESYRDVIGYAFDSAFEAMLPCVAQSDFIVANLETPIAGESLQYAFESYSFNAPVEFAAALGRMNVNLVTTANNHCLDRGIEGLDSTLRHLDALGLAHMGTHSEREDSFMICNIGGINVGFLAFTYGTNAFSNLHYLPENRYYAVDLLQEQELHRTLVRKLYRSSGLCMRAVRKICRKAHLLQMHVPVHERRESNQRRRRYFQQTVQACRDSGAEMIIACMHLGGQHHDAPTAYTKELCDYALDMGVDVVVGNHEHVVHPCKPLPNKMIAYCLGNFLSTAGVLRPPYDTNADCSVILHLYITKEDTRVRLESCSFSVIIQQECGGGRVRAVPLFDLLSAPYTDSQREKLFEKNTRAVNTFLGTSQMEIEPQSEYRLS